MFPLFVGFCFRVVVLRCLLVGLYFIVIVVLSGCFLLFYSLVFSCCIWLCFMIGVFFLVVFLLVVFYCCIPPVLFPIDFSHVFA